MADMGIRGHDRDARQRFCCRTLRWVILTTQKQGIRLADIQFSIGRCTERHYG